MTRPYSAVAAFLERIQTHDPHSPATCRFQAAAELRVAMLQKLFRILERTDLSPPTAKELCQSAQEMLTDVVVLYRSSLEQVHRRAGDE
ncbi:hypothetical protein HP532_13630 [Pseudomonas sp. CrR25]|nr:hypothetical protein [Pseudomonas sp. CrR25]